MDSNTLQYHEKSGYFETRYLLTKFLELMNELIVSPQVCIVEKFTNCFCDKDKIILMDIFESEEARRDSLTGLYNRSGFITYAGRIIETEREDGLHGLLFIDMDYFKMVNDNPGHRAGDDLLVSVGKVLTGIIGPDDIAARFGGDEFVLFLPHTSPEAVAQIKEAAGKSLVYPFSTGEISFVVTASIGVSMRSSESPYTLEEMLHQADTSMYEAKKRVK